MKFQIKTIKIDGEYIELSHSPTQNDLNVFSMLVGKNAVGKTRALSKIVNSYVFEKDYHEVVEASDSLRHPARIIAVSNSKFDRFPDPALYGMKNSLFGAAYHYFGLGSFRASPSRILSKAVETILARTINDVHHSNALIQMLDYVGFLPLLQFDLRRPFRSVNRTLVNSTSFQDEYRRATATAPRDSIVFDYDFESCIMPALDYFEQRELKGKGLSLRIDLAHRNWLDDDFVEFCEFSAILLQAGLAKVSKLTLHDKRTKDKLQFSRASSGQQCMLLMFMGIMGAITDHSLICIDEPEISLHPKWQTEFIGILQETFKHFRGCHFIIATHSPQVIAGLISENGFITDLETKLLSHSSRYSQKSADFQLTEVFHEPGFRNEYLIRTLLVILSKLAGEHQLSSSDQEKIIHVEKVKKRLASSDPVLHLLNQIKMLLG